MAVIARLLGPAESASHQSRGPRGKMRRGGAVSPLRGARVVCLRREEMQDHLPQPKSAVADFGHFIEWPNPRYSEVRLGRGRGWGSTNGAPPLPHLPTPHPD